MKIIDYKIVNGKKMFLIEEPIKKLGGVIEDNQGQWKYPGQITKINSPNITMKGVNYPVLGISNKGHKQLMMPEQEYTFDGQSVTEYPITAQAGTTVKVNINNKIKEFDISSQEYKDLYNSGKLMSYDKNSNTYISTPLKEVVITAEAPQWLKDKRQFEKEYTKDKFIDEAMPKFSRSMGISADNMHPNNIAEYDKRINDKVAESILKRIPKIGNSEKERLKWYNSFTDKEREIIMNSNSYNLFEPAKRAYDINESNKAKEYSLKETFTDTKKLAQTVQGTPERFRFFPNAKNNIESYVNPGMLIGSMAKGLGNVPKDIKNEDYGQAALSIATPLIGGASGSIGAKTTGQFLKNTMLPLGGLEETALNKSKDLIGKILSKNRKIIDLYRIEEQGAKTFAQLAEENKIPKVFNTPEVLARKANEEKHFGQWFTNNIDDIYWYAKDREFTNPQIYHVQVPESKLKSFKGFDESLSRAKDREFILPDNIKSSGKIYNGLDEFNQSFKSEINWRQWNKEIPDNPQLMQEYNKIEQQAKANGTWMKNPDGSAFQGTPEQFVQQNSKNFKKAFPEYHGEILNHNTNAKLNTIDESFFNKGAGDTGYYGKGIYTHPKKEYTKMYGKNNYEFYLNSKNKGFLDKSNIDDAEYFKRSDDEILQHNLPEYENKLINYELDPSRYYDNAKEKWLNKLNEQVKAGKISRDKLDEFTSLHNPKNGEVVIPFNNRIKSAIGNNGMFDMSNPNIYKTLFGGLTIGTLGKKTMEKKEFGGKILNTKIENGKKYFLINE